jgi:hypothetical protein
MSLYSVLFFLRKTITSRQRSAEGEMSGTRNGLSGLRWEHEIGTTILLALKMCLDLKIRCDDNANNNFVSYLFVSQIGIEDY